MSNKYLDETGLGKLWGKIKDAFLGKQDTAYKTASIPFGEVDATSTNTVFTASVPGVTELRDGICFWLENSVVTSASGFTLNVNGLGAKPCFSNLSGERSATGLTKNRRLFLVYSESVTDGGGWFCYYGYYPTTDNDYRAYRIYRYRGSFKAAAAIGRYKILLWKDDNYLLPTTTTINSTGTSKVMTTEEFDPFGQIYYYYSTTTVSADNVIGVTALYYKVENIDLRYSFNISTTALTANKPVYIVADLQDNGMAKLAANAIATELPSSDDGHIYINLGRAYSGYQIELDMYHPVYKWVNGKVRQIHRDSLTVGGHTVNADVPANAKFTDTVTTAEYTYDDQSMPVVRITTEDDYCDVLPASAADNLQPALVSGTNIKTINNQSILGSGNISISGGETNQNAFSNVKVGSVTIEADSKTDTLTLQAGDNILLTPNASSDTIKIAVDAYDLYKNRDAVANQTFSFFDWITDYDIMNTPGSYPFINFTDTDNDFPGTTGLLEVSGSSPFHLFKWYDMPSGVIYYRIFDESIYDWSTGEWMNL